MDLCHTLLLVKRGHAQTVLIGLYMNISSVVGIFATSYSPTCKNRCGLLCHKDTEDEYTVHVKYPAILVQVNMPQQSIVQKHD
jgi:hypothetical protein